MDFGSFLRDIGRNIGNFFGVNKDDEEKKRQAQATQTTAPRLSTSLAVPTTQTQAQTPSTVSTSLNMPTVAPVPTVNPNTSKQPIASRQELDTYNRLLSEGKTEQANRLSSAIAQSYKDTRQANYDNSLLGKIGNFGQEVAKTVVEPVVGLGEGLGTAIASNTGAFRNAESAIQNARNEDARTVSVLNERLKDPSLSGQQRQSLTSIRDFIGSNDVADYTGLNNLYAESRANTDPLNTVLNAAGTVATPLVGGLAGSVVKSAPKVASAVNVAVDPLTLLNKIPKTTKIGQFLNKDITAFARNPSSSAASDIANSASRTAVQATDKELGDMGSGIASKNIANVERQALEEVARNASDEASKLATVERSTASPVTREIDLPQVTTEIADSMPSTQPQRFTAPALQRAEPQTTRLQRVETATPETTPVQQAVPEAQAMPEQAVAEQAIPEQVVPETPVTTQVADQPIELAPTPFDEPMQTTTPSGDIVTGSRLESQANMNARQAAEQAPPVAPENVQKPVNDTTAREIAQARAEAQYTSPFKGGKAGAPGNAKVSYNTGNQNLDSIINDSIISVRGTASTAEARFEALVNAGISAEKQRAIRDIAVKNVDKVTGRVSPEAQARINNIINGPEPGAQRGTTPQPEPVSPKFKEDTGSSQSQQTIDERVLKSDAKANDYIAKANAELSAEGSSYAKLATKLYNNKQKIGEFSPLTAAEKKVVDQIQPELNAVLTKMNELGLTDADMRLISQYLPTAKLDETGAINTAADVASRDFGFLKGRGGSLSADQVEAGADEALRNYLRTGALLDDLTPEQVGKIKLDRMDNEFKDLIEKGINGADTGIRASDAEIESARKSNQEIIKAQDELSTAQKKVDDGDTSNNAIADAEQARAKLTDKQIQKKVDDYILLEKKTRAQIANTKARNDISPEQKKRDITQLESHLRDVRNDTYYLQSTTRTNLLFGVGRIADQVNKGVAVVSDATTSPLARFGANTSFTKQTGRKVFADSPTTNAVWDKVKDDPRLFTAKRNADITKRVLAAQGKGGALNRVSNAWRRTGTKLTEAGSRYKAPNKDTVSFFVSDAQARGMTDPTEIASYIKNKIGTKEWNNIHQSFYDARNAFTGTYTRGNAGAANMIPDIKNPISDLLYKKTNLSQNAIDNIADGISIPVVGFPRLMFRLGSRGLDNATAGLPNFIKAAKIKPKSEADALKKALYIQQGLRDAQTGPALGALGMGLGASGMVTGAYPDDAKERARWQRDRIQPYSIKIGDQYVDAGRYLGPLAFPIMIGASITSGENPAGTVLGVSKQILNQYGADSMANVLEQASAILSGDITSVSDSLQRTAAGITDAFIPAASILNTVGKAEDMVLQRAKPDTSGGYVDSVRARLPLVRAGMPTQTDTLGNPISQGTAWNLLPGVSGGQNTSTVQGDQSATDVTSEVDRLAELGFETMPSSGSKNAEGADKFGSLLLNSDYYNSASDEQKAEYMSKALLGTAGKDINDSLDTDQQSVLLQKQLIGENQHKKNLDTATYARDYYNAEYANKIANDTLTEDDDNLGSVGSLHYKAISSQVNASFTGWTDALENLYEATSEKELYAMSDSDPNKQLLLDLDAARADAGVSRDSSDHSTAKYDGITSGSYGSSSSKASTGFSLPSITVKSPTSGTSSLASLEVAPSSASLPTVAKTRPKTRRSISVKSGVSL